jgi:1-acylglycerone phosphate reductase
MMKSSPKSDHGELAKKKTVLITGCSEGGIGSSLALAFHHHGCRVFATARNISKVQHLSDIGIEVLEMDVLDEASCKLAAESVGSLTGGGGLDFLVNNSGIGMCFSSSSLSMTCDFWFGVWGLWLRCLEEGGIMGKEAD